MRCAHKSHCLYKTTVCFALWIKQWKFKNVLKLWRGLYKKKMTFKNHNCLKSDLGISNNPLQSPFTFLSLSMCRLWQNENLKILILIFIMMAFRCLNNSFQMSLTATVRILNIWLLSYNQCVIFILICTPMFSS